MADPQSVVGGGEGAPACNVAIVKLEDPGQLETMRAVLRTRIGGIEAVDRQTAYENVPGYSEQQSTLATQNAFALLIGMLVIGGFFQIQTLQKVPQIGMLKAIGITGWQLVGTFAIESLSLTVSSTLAGTVAGTGLGYLFYKSNNVMQNVPTVPAFDALTVGFVLTMVIVASLVSAAIASRGIVRQRVTQILRGA